MNESDARGEDDLDRREAEVMCFQAAFEGVDGSFVRNLSNDWKRLKPIVGYNVSV